jgi:hypothetical protein
MTHAMKILLVKMMMEAINSGDLELVVKTPEGSQEVEGYGFNKYDGQDGPMTFELDLKKMS